MTLADLPKLYAEARAVAVHPPATNTCIYCGKFWRQWAATKHPPLPGHAKCIVTAEFRAALTAAWWADPTLTIAAIAQACNVSVPTVAAWLGRKRK